MNGAASSVLDASALLAYLQDEPGADVVEAALAEGAVINAANLAEALTRLSDTGRDLPTVYRQLQEPGLIGDFLSVATLVEEDAFTIARLRASTRVHGLSLGDRACLATGLRLGRPVLTTDRIWAALDVGVTVRLIRP